MVDLLKFLHSNKNISFLFFQLPKERSERLVIVLLIYSIFSMEKETKVINHIPQDLKVTLKRFSTVVGDHDQQTTEKGRSRSLFLSNIDRTLMFSVETIHFFSADINFPHEKIVEILENTLRTLLVTYDFCAGRFKFHEGGRVEVDCNSAGAGFVVSESESTLDQLGDLVYPNPAFRQLIVETMPTLPPDNQPLLILQVTLFKCGGFAMSISTNHALMDGLSFKLFLQNLASVAANKPLAAIPCNDRQLLAARSPPKVAFSHPELLKIPPQIQQGDVHGLDEDLNAKLFQTTMEELDIKVFRLSEDDIIRLKEKANMVGINDSVPISATPDNFKITGFNVVMAHIWRCKALSGLGGDNKGNDPKKTSTILYAVDIRSRLRPPLPPSYTGNAVVTAYGTATFDELEKGPFPQLVKIISQGATRITDEYARSIIDWGELHKGYPYGDVLVSSWWRLGFGEVEFPWGRPKYSCPLVHHRKDIILLFPDKFDEQLINARGVNVLVALPTQEMEIFQDIFHKFLA